MMKRLCITRSVGIKFFASGVGNVAAVVIVVVQMLQLLVVLKTLILKSLNQMNQIIKKAQIQRKKTLWLSSIILIFSGLILSVYSILGVNHTGDEDYYIVFIFGLVTLLYGLLSFKYKNI